MKGIVFTEFFEMVEKNHGYEMVDYLILNSNLSSKGEYTAIGTYSHEEIISLVVTLSELTGEKKEILLNAFGSYLFDVFLKSYKNFFHDAPDLFSFLISIDSYIHVEVQKIYPDATLPKFDAEQHGDTMILIYESPRKFGDLAVGLLSKSFEYFNEPCTLEMIKLVEDGSKVKFIITKKH